MYKYPSSASNVFTVVIVGAKGNVAFQTTACSLVSKANILQTSNMFPILQFHFGIWNKLDKNNTYYKI